MRIQNLSLHRYQIPLTNGQIRTGALINISNKEGKQSCGEIAPFQNWSTESLEQCMSQVIQKKTAILQLDWTTHGLFDELRRLELYPSVVFGLESALLSILDPLPAHTVSTSALLMGTVSEIRQQANLRLSEGFTSAKLKVGNLSFEDAFNAIHQLKDKFYLRIDVNRAWETADALQFFSQFPKDAFDYVEEPFKNPNDLVCFQHPLAIDESFPHNFSLKQLEELPTLKALIYKPTLQGGLLGCLPLQKWTKQKGVSLVLSSSFESNIGLTHIASMAYRLSLVSPVGIGTGHFMTDHLSHQPLRFSGSELHVPRL